MTHKENYAYLYTTPTYELKHMYKVGYTSWPTQNLSALSRGTPETGKYVKLKIIPLEMTDALIHDILLTLGLIRQKNDTKRYNEWFLFGNNPINEFTIAVDKALEKFNEHYSDDKFAIRLMKNNNTERGYSLSTGRVLKLLIDFNLITYETYKDLELKYGFILTLINDQELNFNINNKRAFCGPTFNKHLDVFPIFESKELQIKNVKLVNHFTKFKQKSLF